jgi:hypothetical protein
MEATGNQQDRKSPAKHRSKKQKREHRQIVLMFPCTCGAQHRLLLGLGEIQIFTRAIYKGKGLENFTLRHTVLPSLAQREALKKELDAKAQRELLLKELREKVKPVA